jgi:uncharacterized protein (TIGR02145 family)
MLKILFVSISILSFVSCDDEGDKSVTGNDSPVNPDAEIIIDHSTDIMTDTRDGKVYNTVTVGEQTWMAENLNFDIDTGDYCMDDLPEKCEIYGKLYNWEAAVNFVDTLENDSILEGICPPGWRIPSQYDWETLANYIAVTTDRLDETPRYWPELNRFFFSEVMGGYDNFSFNAYGSGEKYGATSSGFENQYANENQKAIWLTNTKNQDNEIIVFYMSIVATNLGFRTIFYDAAAAVRCILSE